MKKNFAAPNVISMADYLARKGKSSQSASPGAKEIDGGPDSSSSGSPTIIPFPAPRPPLPAA
jgi:hypothetical protein